MRMANNALYYAAAATTAIAGILHLILVPNVIGSNVNTAIFFLVAGIAQLFWVVPMIKKWGKIWYYIGIAGTIILIIMWAMTRLPGNPITGRAGQINEMAIAIEVLQIAYIIITAIIIGKETRSPSQTIKDKT
jgi:Ca2+/Na+ antiporter